MINTTNFLDALDFALAGAMGYAIALGNFSHAICFLIFHIIIGIIQRKRKLKPKP